MTARHAREDARRARASIRRAGRALELIAALPRARAAYEEIPTGTPERDAARLRLMALGCRADAWAELASGDAAMAAAHRRDARRFAALARAVTVGG